MSIQRYKLRYLPVLKERLWKFEEFYIKAKIE